MALTSAAIAVPSAVVYYTLAYSGCVLGDMAPAAAGTLTKATSDANGAFSIDITNANPLHGCTATVVFSGGNVYTGATQSLTRVLTWSKPVPTSVTVSPSIV
ncbi:MAG: hypothetical protein EBT65_05925, partial [Actinobacteria bacterium]|nr:hypothetical protein [Actinomycetota bacterium]